MKLNIIIGLLISSAITFLAMNQEGARGLPILIAGICVMIVHLILIMIMHTIGSYRSNSNLKISSVLKEMGIVLAVYLLIISLGVIIGNS